MGGRFSINNIWIQTLLVFIFAATYMSFFQGSTTNLYGFDPHYHIKIAEMYRTDGIVYDMPWMYYTVYNDKFADVYFLYHLLQSPFTFFNLTLAAKLSQIVFFSLAISMIYYFLRKRNVTYSFLWILIALSFDYAFIHRMTMPRGAALSLFFFVLATHFLFEKQYEHLFITVMLYTYSYPAFITFLGFATLYFFLTYFKDKNLEWKILAYTMLPAGIALIINPFFPNNLFILFYHTVLTSSSDAITTVITEWMPLFFKRAIIERFVMFIIFFLSISYFVYRFKNQDKKTMSLMIMASIFYIMMLLHNRFVEYWVPFTVIFAAVIFSELLKNFTQNYLASKSKRRIFLVIIVFICTLGFVYSHSLFNPLLERFDDRNNFEQCSNWLKENTEPQSKVFIFGWHHFPPLFFYNTHNYYTLGFDEYNMYYFDEELYATYVSIRTNTSDNKHLILDEFDSKYIFIPNHQMYSQLFSSNTTYLKIINFNQSDFTVSFENDHCKILALS